MSNLSKWFRLLMVLPCIALIGGFVVAMSSPNQFAVQTAVSTAGPTSTAAPLCPPDCQPLIDELSQGGSLEVVVQLKVPFQPETALSDADVQVQRAAIIQAQALFWKGDYGSPNIVYGATPYVQLLIDKKELNNLIADPYVSTIREDLFTSGEFDLSNKEWVASDLFDLGLSHIRNINSTPSPSAAPANSTSNPAQCVPDWATLFAKAKQAGIVQIIVDLKSQALPTLSLNASVIQAFEPQNAASRLAESSILRAMVQDNLNIPILRTVSGSPALVLRANQAQMVYLLASPFVNDLREDGTLAPLSVDCTALAAATPTPATPPTTPNAYGICNTGTWKAWIPNLDTLHQLGYTGKQQTLVIVDSGVDAKHPYFTDINGQNSRVVTQACFSTPDTQTPTDYICPNHQSSDVIRNPYKQRAFRPRRATSENEWQSARGRIGFVTRCNGR